MEFTLNTVSLKAKLLLGFFVSTFLVSCVALFAYLQISSVAKTTSANKRIVEGKIEMEGKINLVARNVSEITHRISSFNSSHGLAGYDVHSAIESVLDSGLSALDSEKIAEELKALYDARLAYFRLREEIPPSLSAEKTVQDQFALEAMTELVALGEAAQDRANNASLNTARKNSLRLLKTANISTRQLKGIPDFASIDEKWTALRRNIEYLNTNYLDKDGLERQAMSLASLEDFIDSCRSEHRSLFSSLESRLVALRENLSVSLPSYSHLEAQDDIAIDSPEPQTVAYQPLLVSETLSQIASQYFDYRNAKISRSKSLLEKSLATIQDKLEAETKRDESLISDDFIAVEEVKEIFSSFVFDANQFFSKMNESLALVEEISLQETQRAGGAFTEKARGYQMRLEELGSKHDFVNEAASRISERIDGLTLVFESVDGIESGIYQLLQKRDRMRGAEDHVHEALNQFHDEAWAQFQDVAEMLGGDLASGVTVAYRARDVLIYGCLFAILVSIVLGFSLSQVIASRLRIQSTALNDITLSLNQATEQIQAASASLATGSSEQAAALEQTSASVQEVEARSKGNDQSAQKTTDSTQRARSTAEEGVDDMLEMESAMIQISQSSNQIADIIKTIEEIAFQTNILALNAAVEAARAGEAGSGFAVVADEVRSLAQRSSQAAQDTGEKIRQAIANSEQGVEISQKAKERLQEILERTKEADMHVSEIGESSQMQHASISQIANAISHIDQVTQANAGNAEESASAAKLLRNQSDKLLAVVSDLMTLIEGETSEGNDKNLVNEAGEKAASDRGEENRINRLANQNLVFTNSDPNSLWN